MLILFDIPLSVRALRPVLSTGVQQYMYMRGHLTWRSAHSNAMVKALTQAVHLKLSGGGWGFYTVPVARSSVYRNWRRGGAYAKPYGSCWEACTFT